MTNASNLFAKNSLDADWHLQSLIRNAKQARGRIRGNGRAKLALKNLLQAYIMLVETYYAQYRKSLKKEFKKKSSSVDKEQIPIIMHRAIEKLSREWERIFQVLSAARFIDSRLDVLRPVIEAASDDIGLNIQEFVALPHFGRRFSLVSFKYTKDFVTLGIPVFNLYTPWEWSIFWHEMAGRKVQIMKAKQPDVFAKLIPSNYKSSSKQNNNDSTASNPSWPADWMEELFEDGCSVLAFGPDFLPILESILRRYSADSDMRHPPIDIRLDVARLLLKQDLDHKVQPEVQEAAKNVRKLLAKKCPDLFERPGSSGRKVRKAILKAMKKFHKNPSKAKTINKKLQKDLELLVPGKVKAADKAQVKQNLQNNIAQLLGNLNHSALMNLTLSEIDFMVSVPGFDNHGGHNPSDHNHSDNVITIITSDNGVHVLTRTLLGSYNLTHN